MLHIYYSHCIAVSLFLYYMAPHPHPHQNAAAPLAQQFGDLKFRLRLVPSSKCTEWRSLYLTYFGEVVHECSNMSSLFIIETLSRVSKFMKPFTENMESLAWGESHVCHPVQPATTNSA